ASASAVSDGASATGVLLIHSERLCSSATFIGLSFAIGKAAGGTRFRRGIEKGGPADRPLEIYRFEGEPSGVLLLERQAAEALVELRHTPALVDLAAAAGPRRVAGRIDVERHRVAVL